MMDWVPLVITLILGVTCLAISLERAVARIKLARKRVAALHVKRQAQLQKMRKLAAKSLQLKRALAGQVDRNAGVAAEIEKLEAELRKAVDPSQRILVLEERKGGIELSWIATVTCSPADPSTAAWTGTRRYLMWAASEDLARARLSRKMPAEQGYRIQRLQQIQLSPKTGIPLSIPA